MTYPALTFILSLVSLPLSKCFSDLKYCPCPPACDWGRSVFSLVTRADTRPIRVADGWAGVEMRVFRHLDLSVIDRRTNQPTKGQTDKASYRVASLQLKTSDIGWKGRGIQPPFSNFLPQPYTQAGQKSSSLNFLTASLLTKAKDLSLIHI